MLPQGPSLPHTSSRSTAELLYRLAAAGLQCTGVIALSADEIELWVASQRDAVPTSDCVARGFPGAHSRIQVERRPDGLRFRLEVGPGFWISWSGEPAPRSPNEEPRLLAFEVTRGDDARGEEVVMAGSPDEAASYYARGWGLPQGALVHVVWEDSVRGAAQALLPARQQRLFRVIGPGLVRILPA